MKLYGGSYIVILVALLLGWYQRLVARMNCMPSCKQESARRVKVLVTFQVFFTRCRIAGLLNQLTSKIRFSSRREAIEGFGIASL